MISLRHRQGVAAVVLGLSILVAVYVAIPGDGVAVASTGDDEGGWPSALVALIDALNRLELVHVGGHVLVFGGVGMLLGYWGTPPQRGNAGLAARYLLAGAVGMEAGQAIAGYGDDTLGTLLTATAFDLAVDGIAGGLGVGLTWWRDQASKWSASSSKVGRGS